MKLALCLMFTNELPWLRLHLPIFKDDFDGIVSITDNRTTDGSIEYMLDIGAKVIIDDWQYDWGKFATHMVEAAESFGFDAAMRLDPDEMLEAGAGKDIKEMLEKEATLLVFPRHEFFGDREHVRGDIYPDWQARAWRLKRGIVVGGTRHEGVNFMRHGLSEHTDDPEIRVMRVTSPHIFHYGWASRHGIWDNQVKYQSHAQVAVGGPPEVNFPPNTPLAWHPTVRFLGRQPLDPELCGLYAPWDA